MKSSLDRWMAWEGGIDLVALTDPALAMPNVIVHVARLVHTPIGAAPSGMILFQPDVSAAPLAMGFVSHDSRIGAWFGPNIFAGTPFEQAPSLAARIDVDSSSPGQVTARLEVGGHTFEVRMGRLGPLEMIQRAPSAMPPFAQQGLEAVPGDVSLKVDGAEISLLIPPVGISGGPAAVWSPCGIYAR